jgi:hypothetical protein
MSHHFYYRRLILLQGCINVILALVLGFFHAETMVSLVAILGLSIITLGLNQVREDYWVYGIFLATGYLGELWAVYNQVWQYTYSNVAGIPWYIGPAWGIIGVSAWRLGLAIQEWQKNP